MQKFQDIKYFSNISSIFIIFFAVPSYYYLIKQLRARRGIVTLSVLSILPVVIEAMAVRTGFPYGGFEYGDKLGYLLFDLVPPSISFAYLPILLGSLYIASQHTTKLINFSFFTSFFMVLVDLVIDPAAVSIGFWHYDNPGVYYGVPFSNFMGWIITGFIYAIIFYSLTGKDFLPLNRGLSYSLLWIISFWIGYLFIVTYYIPAIIGIIIYLYVYKKMSI
jgi:putative membrane protein